MKHLSRAIIAVFMAILMGTLLPVQVFADTPDYISDVRICMGSEYDTQFNGYNVLKVDNNSADLNEKAAGNDNPAGEKPVYLYYKTTKNPSDAITDLAVMNMKGGYSIDDYDMLMETNIKEQILPFIANFSTAITEYRENYNSNNEANKQRAVFVHDVLNKLTDDDTGKRLGDLLLNETKEELGEEAYNKLSNEEKKNHANLTKIIAQANGRATLIMENMITKACDTSDDSWIDRFSSTTYEDLADMIGGSPSDAMKKLAKKYDDDANILLSGWNAFNEQLESYEEYQSIVEGFDEEEVNGVISAYEKADEDEKAELEEDYKAACEAFAKFTEATQGIIVYEYLEEYDYNDATLLDFFMQSESEIEDDITVLYPLVASLSAGQRAGLDFLSLREMVMIARSNEYGYDDEAVKSLKDASIYEGIDRAVYEKGGVGLTSDARRNNLSAQNISEYETSSLTYIFIAVSFGFLISSVAMIFKTLSAYSYANKIIDTEVSMSVVQSAYNTSKLCLGLTISLAVIAVVVFAVGIYLDQKAAEEFYKTKFTPIPHYMVDAKDITGYNRKGEKIVLKNQAAYYKAVECNRKKTDAKYKEIGTLADLNGDVGSQWLALYAAKNDKMEPILADSLKVVVGSTEVPQGYETGIHMFGESAAFNLNNKLYCWNQKAKSIMVYYKADKTAATTTGSNFSTGTLALSASGGLILGAAITALGMTASKKRKENKTVSV